MHSFAVQDKRSSSAEELQKQSYVGPMYLSQVHFPTQSCYLSGTTVFLPVVCSPQMCTHSRKVLLAFHIHPLPNGAVYFSYVKVIAGVMACSQDLHEGDLVAVSIAMEAPGTNGYVTRGSVVGSDLIAESTLYIGVYLTSSAAKPSTSIRQSFQ